MGMAERVPAGEVRSGSPPPPLDGVGEMPAGVPIEDGTMKSSRFTWSSLLGFACCEDFQSCAIPLGGLGRDVRFAASLKTRSAQPTSSCAQ